MSVHARTVSHRLTAIFGQDRSLAEERIRQPDAVGIVAEPGRPAISE